jgi:hypothetical protein
MEEEDAVEQRETFEFRLVLEWPMASTGAARFANKERATASSGAARFANEQRATAASAGARLADEQRVTATTAYARLAMGLDLRVPPSGCSEAGEAESTSYSPVPVTILQS